MNVHEKLYHLIQVRPYLNRAQYREAAATIVAKDLADQIQEKNVEFKRTMVLDRTNLTLRALNIPEISYGFIRKFL